MWNKLKSVYPAISRELSKNKALRIFLLITLVLAGLWWLLIRPASKPDVVVTPHVTAPVSDTVSVDSVTQAAIGRVKRARP